MPLVTVTPPSTEPVALEEAKLYLKVDDDEDDDVVAGLIASARASIEQLIGRALIEQTLRLELEGPPACGELRLPRPPLLEVTSVQYVDTAGATQTWSSALYQVQRNDSGVSLLRPAYGQSWPSVRSQFGAFKVTFTAGYGKTAAVVPEQARTAIKQMAAFLYENRGDSDAKVPDYIRHIVADLIVY